MYSDLVCHVQWREHETIIIGRFVIEKQLLINTIKIILYIVRKRVREMMTRRESTLARDQCPGSGFYVFHPIVFCGVHVSF